MDIHNWRLARRLVRIQWKYTVEPILARTAVLGVRLASRNGQKVNFLLLIFLFFIRKLYNRCRDFFLLCRRGTTWYCAGLEF